MFNIQRADRGWRSDFWPEFDLTYSPALFVETEPENGYRSLSTVNLAFLGFGEDKLPETFKEKIITLAAPMPLWTELMKRG